MAETDVHIRNREELIARLRQELVGPSPSGNEIHCSDRVALPEVRDAFKPWRQSGSGEEILTSETPGTRYGVGVLYPLGVQDEEGQAEPNPAGLELVGNGQKEGVEADGKKEVKRFGSVREADDFDFDLSLANSYKPSSMAVSFLASVPEGAHLVVEATGGRYERKRVEAGGKTYTWWLRRPVRLSTEIPARRLYSGEGRALKPDPKTAEGLQSLDLAIEIMPRRGSEEGQLLLTVALVNRSRWESSYDAYCLFQSHISVRVEATDGAASVLPYPGAEFRGSDEGEGELARLAREEDESLALLYRNRKTFAVGHGCAADWEEAPGGGGAILVRGEALPVVEVPNTTAEIRRQDGSKVDVRMASLAGLVEGDDGFAALRDVVAAYESWIDSRDREIEGLPDPYRGAAARHVEEARRCAVRMWDGIRYLEEDAEALAAFRLSNHAILLQQVRALRQPRKVKFNEKRHELTFSSPAPDPDLLDPEQGRWRAFQIAFLLMSLRSSAEGEHRDRERVELIWFPTGGGKTEAYLGLAAFTIFLRYIRDPKDHGVHVLMRYTLRLLTAQQFQRASRLICAMDYLRREWLPEVKEPISIGIWVGSATTFNARKDALETLGALQKRKRNVENRFVVTSCPWCGAEMGPVRLHGKGAPNVVGYDPSGGTVVFRCPDRSCEFGRGLPIYVIDEDVYERRPDLVIGTVDKFAMLAWKPDARALFGIDAAGARIASPPGLIIQDELHLISGPLGSMVGIYEALIERLCTDERRTPSIPPKIVSSTATIRRYEAQVRALFAREGVTLFPPPGLDASDSFFAREATDGEGRLLPGKKYVGLHAPGLGSAQTAQVRTFAALLMAPEPLSAEERDPWWTLLVFYNSLRELGGALSLFQSDIPEYIRGLRQRDGLERQRFLKDYTILELTGRISGEEVPEAIGRLEVTTTDKDGKRPVDACLASNIIEVGVDIDRLSLMAVVGQPKTTSQYIQVTGRVGRRWYERPGLVVTLYTASKPRDRSHFEQFRSYHDRLYAQVEPTSVTPFSPPALDRALHAVMVAYVRQFGSSDVQPYPVPSELLQELRDILLPRLRVADAAEEERFRSTFERRIQQWERFERDSWTTDDGTNPGLMYASGDYVPEDHRRVTWAVPMSMRNVDAECVLQIQLPRVDEATVHLQDLK